MDKAEKQIILEELGGISEDIYDNLVQGFISQTMGEIVELKGVLSNDDFDSVAKIAHCIRGAAANLRFTLIQEIVRVMEIAAKERRDELPFLEERGGSISVNKEIILDCIAKMEKALEDIKGE